MLFRSVKSDGECKNEFTFHDVKIKCGTTLSSVLGESITVNSCHHQSVKDLGEGLHIAASADDGTIEAIEHNTLPCFGVQWHPERPAGDILPCQTLFNYFVSLCKR